MSVDLTRYEDDYQKAEPPTGNYDSLPDGNYQVRVETVELGVTRSAGDPILKWQLEVIAGEHEGRFLFRNNLFASADNLKFLKADLARCGLTLSKLSDLETRLEDLLDVELEVKKVTSNKSGKVYENVYIQKRLERGAAVAGGNGRPFGAGTESVDPSKEDLPF